jgi:hypothetical protein
MIRFAEQFHKLERQIIVTQITLTIRHETRSSASDYLSDVCLSKASQFTCDFFWLLASCFFSWTLCLFTNVFCLLSAWRAEWGTPSRKVHPSVVMKTCFQLSPRQRCIHCSYCSRKVPSRCLALDSRYDFDNPAFRRHIDMVRSSNGRDQKLTYNFSQITYRNYTIWET